MKISFGKTARYALAISALLLAGPAFAQATRTWVSGVGDDVNPCSRTAPCKTFAGAISKTAAGGEISVLDPGGFGAVTITKPITIDGNGVVSSILSSATNGVIINISAATYPSAVVTLRNLSINGAGTTLGLNGIRVLAAGTVNIENVTAERFSGWGLDIEPTTGSVEVNVINSSFSQGGTGGILVKPTSPAVVSLSVSGSSLLNNATGLRVERFGTASIGGSTISGNTSFGALLQSALNSASMTVDSCLVSGNGIGVRSNGAGGDVFISNNTITGNVTGIDDIASGELISLGNNTVIGNGTNGAPTSTVPET